MFVLYFFEVSTNVPQLFSNPRYDTCCKLCVKTGIDNRQGVLGAFRNITCTETVEKCLDARRTKS